METVTISPKFQVVIPKSIREKLHLKAGQKVEAIEYDGRIEYVVIRPIEEMRGFAAGMDSFVEREEDREL
jgi:AbrB family looped-hinge helix DNA binding protein